MAAPAMLVALDHFFYLTPLESVAAAAVMRTGGNARA